MASRPWYAFYPADYEQDTAHLTLMQHGAYRRLLDHYYSTGKPLPANAGVLHRICRAFDDAERAAVNHIMATFFKLADDGYHSGRVDKELLKASEISEKRKDAANSRYAKAPANAVQMHTQLQPQSQIQPQKIEESTASQAKTRPKARKGLPAGFPSEADLDWSKTLWLQRSRSDLCSGIQDEIAKFRDHYEGHGKSMASWPAAWRTWTRNAIKYNNGGHNGRSKPSSAHDKFFAAGESIIADLRREAANGTGKSGTGGEDALALGCDLLPP